ncbi:NAD-dependent epimerase/dehydratase family protein [Mucilaginibacter lacusdianchii]|uniref:NAD-dependent epimerase/dehydratase family protein n=1 Tax=Mucilaginibacter lacusdianchii TaxID=2684211 RepID=UPI00131DE8EE|nr:NAD(P)-dependent oxidoreductase [Mucilaginibacter sp. JXJ CY 39]
MIKVIVTGGSGFIGTNLIENLVQDNFSVLNLDKSSPVNPEQIPYWQNVDILNAQALEKAVTEFEPEIIIHLAAVTDLDGKTDDYYRTNVAGTQNVIDVAAKTPSLKKVIYTSSMYVCKPGIIPTDYRTFKPHTRYGESKVAGELLVINIKNPHYSWTIIRPTSIWGPWFNVPYIDFFNTVYSGRYFDFGKCCTKTYGYVGNTIFQIRKIMAADNVHAKTFYLGDKTPIPISDWANEISLKLGKGPVKSIPFAFIKAAALVGNMLTKVHVKFPMTSFRLKNMMTDNIFPLEDINQLTGEAPFSRAAGTSKTINWLVEHKGYRVQQPVAKPNLKPVLHS